MFQHAKRQVKLFEMHCFTMFIIKPWLIFFIRIGPLLAGTLKITPSSYALRKGVV